MPKEVKTPQTLDGSSYLALRAWNMLGGQIDWQGLPTVCENLGVADIELLIELLQVIRDHG